MIINKTFTNSCIRQFYLIYSPAFSCGASGASKSDFYRGFCSGYQKEIKCNTFNIQDSVTSKVLGNLAINNYFLNKNLCITNLDTYKTCHLIEFHGYSIFKMFCFGQAALTTFDIHRSYKVYIEIYKNNCEQSIENGRTYQFINGRLPAYLVF